MSGRTALSRHGVASPTPSALSLASFCTLRTFGTSCALSATPSPSPTRQKKSFVTTRSPMTGASAKRKP
eukprot:scaffold319437_cov24-Tisochrysis_lutea.AAC.1